MCESDGAQGIKGVAGLAVRGSRPSHLSALGSKTIAGKTHVSGGNLVTCSLLSPWNAGFLPFLSPPALEGPEPRIQHWGLLGPGLGRRWKA